MATKKNPKYERWRWITSQSVTWLAYAREVYLTRKAFSVAKNELKKPGVLGLTKVQMSNMDGAYSAAYAIGQFFWGTLGRPLRYAQSRFARHVGVDYNRCSHGSYQRRFLDGHTVRLARTVAGQWLGAAGKEHGRSHYSMNGAASWGFGSANYALGGFVASIIAGYAAQKYSWRYAFFCPSSAAGCDLDFFCFLSFQRNRPEDLGLPPVEEYHGEREAVIDAKEKPQLRNRKARGMSSSP